MRLRGLTYPIYRQTQGRVRLTLDSAHRIGPETTAKLPRGALALLEVLREVGRPFSTGQIVDLSGRSRPTMTKQLAALRERRPDHLERTIRQRSQSRLGPQTSLMRLTLVDP